LPDSFSSDAYLILLVQIEIVHLVKDELSGYLLRIQEKVISLEMRPLRNKLLKVINQ